MKRPLLIPILFVLVCSISAQAEDQQVAMTKAAKSGELFETIARMGSAIFAAFNAHDVDRINRCYRRAMNLRATTYRL